MELVYCVYSRSVSITLCCRHLNMSPACSAFRTMQVLPLTWRLYSHQCNLHCSGGLSPASHCGGPGSRPDQSVWDLCCTKWHWDRFLSKFFGFILVITFHRGSPYSYIICGMNNRLAGLFSEMLLCVWLSSSEMLQFTDDFACTSNGEPFIFCISSRFHQNHKLPFI
jgi:hypothetical protein